MPTAIGILTPKGLIESPYSAENLAEAARKEPDGIYTTTRTYRHNSTLLLDAHLDRLVQSALLEWIPLRLNYAAVRAALRSLIAVSGYRDSRIRISVPREQPDNVILTLEPFEDVPAELRANGVSTATIRIARHNPSSKTTDWMELREQARLSLPAHVFEGILVNELDELLEGFSSNFYAIWQGTLYTAGRKVLEGIARSVVLQVAPDIVPLELRPITMEALPLIEEAFLTSSGRGIVPISRIDDIDIGSPGPVTQAIARRYDEWVSEHIEPI
jgi:branched-chain amino acid aminotransferase